MNNPLQFRQRLCGFVLIVIMVSLFAASCAPPKKMIALISMIPNQEKYFTREVVSKFAKEHNVRIEVVHYNNIDSVEQEVRKYAGKVGLVKVPFVKSYSMIQNGLIKPLNSICTPAELSEYTKTYLLTSLSQVQGDYYFVPRKFETRIMVYSKSKVAQAVEQWRSFKPEIDNELKKVNGYGLPATFLLDEDPNKWNYFDVFVAGWVWAHTPYDGKTGPKVGHRGRRYSGTSQRIVDRVFSCGGDSTDLLAMSGDPVVDAFEWEAVYGTMGIYNPRMWTEAWSGTGVWKGFAQGEVFLAFMTQLDCFFIHGTGGDSLLGYMPDPDDMGIATMPAGCSVEVDGNGMILRSGSKAVSTGGWWWGIPVDAPDPHLSYELEQFITSTSGQIQECTRFGMIPVRKDILSDISMMFGGGWITEIYETSFNQLMLNKQTMLPTNPRFDKIGELYLDAWFDIVVNKNCGGDYPSRKFIESLLKTDYAPRARRILQQ